MLSSLIVLYLFLGGLGAGIVFIEVTWSMVVKYSGTSIVSLVPYVRQRSIGLLVGCALLVLGGVCLVFDLERPDRALFVLFRPTLSILSVGSYMLVIAAVLAALLSWRSYKGKTSFESMRCYLGVAVLTLLFCFGVMAYTGIYLESIKAVAVWNSPLLPLVFITSSLSCSCAAVFIITMFVEDGWHLRKQLHGWHGFHLVVLAVELIALVVYVFVMALAPSAQESVELLLSPSAYGLWFVGGLGLLGLVVPLCVEVFEFFVNNEQAFPAAHVLCILGGFLLRFCLVSVGLH